MNNVEIIAKEAISAGLYTNEEIEELIKNGKEVPLHTLKGWEARGNYKIKAGSHGIETKLWKIKDKKENQDENDSKDENENEKLKFHLVKAVLFYENQVEKAGD